MGIRFLEGWIPLHRIRVLANLYGGAARFRTLASGRRWSILLIRHDPSMPAVPPGERPTLAEAIEEADRHHHAKPIGPGVQP